MIQLKRPPAGTATEMSTPVPTDTATQTATATGGPMLDTSTPTVVPTSTFTDGSPGANFDTISLSIIEDEHVADIQAELAAEHLVKNEELRAFASMARM